LSAPNFVYSDTGMAGGQAVITGHGDHSSTQNKSNKISCVLAENRYRNLLANLDLVWIGDIACGGNIGIVIG
jgi:hypothetical protein